MISFVPAVATIGVLAYAAWRDLLTRTIPNLASMVLALLGMTLRLSESWAAFGLSAALATVVFLLLVPLIRAGLFGGADAKLLSALAFGLGPIELMRLLLFVSVSGAILAAVYLMLHNYFRRATRHRDRGDRWSDRFFAVELWRIRRRAAVPYGVAIAAGTTAMFISMPGA